MVNLDELVRFDRMTVLDLITFNELVKLGVVKFDLNNPEHVITLTHIITTVAEFVKIDTERMSETDRLMHQQKCQFLELTLQKLAQTAILPPGVSNKI